MSEIIPYYKPLGFTPLQAIEKLRAERPELANVPITYAGRLDPMAEGLLLLLAGDAVHRKEEFLKLDKTYEAKILLGFSSDTFDILGLTELHTVQSEAEQQKSFQHKNPQEILSAVNSLIRKHELPYPAYSSKTIDGKPLWAITKSGDIPIELPTRQMIVHAAQILGAENIPWEKIYANITESVNLVGGDFRQTEILARWSELNEKINPQQEFQIIQMEFKVSSGTYIRTLANELGNKLGTTALLYHLKRTELGEYTSTL